MFKKIKYKGLKIKGNILAAPMAGYSNFPTRMVLQEFGADLTFTEMVSADGIVMGHKKTLELLHTSKKEVSKAVQIFGNDKYIIKDAVDYIHQKTAYKIVNLNAGCPVKKILKAKKGGALIRDIDKLKEILTFLSSKIKLSFTLKIRSGWDKDNINYSYIGKLAQDNNCKMIILHPRTVMQRFIGHADWDMIYDLAAQVKIPVIGNGDIRSPEDAYNRFKGGDIDGIMIGRGFFGNPWIFTNIKKYFKRRKYPVPDIKERIKIMMHHLSMMTDFFGERKGIIIFRAQMFSYLKNFRYSAAVRKKLQDKETLINIKDILSEYNLF